MVVMVATVALASSALAANPHYVGPKGPTYSVDSSTGALTVNFKAAGYGSGQFVGYSASFDFAVTWGCITPPRSNEPSGLESESGSQVVQGTLQAGRTGTLSGPLTLFTPSGFECPSHNMQEVLISASYTNISFTLEGIGATTGGSASFTR
jgi:hypothetical protein